MRWKQIAELIKVNLLYANPQMIEKKRNKEAETGVPSKVPAYMSVVWQNVLLFAVFFFVFLGTFLASGVDFTQYPGLFSRNILLFLVMTVLQAFLIVYNLFYESRDLVHYLPLPFLASEVFLAKLAVLLLTVMPYLIPVLGLFFILGMDAGHFLLWNIAGSLLLFCLLVAVLFFLTVLLVHLMTRVPFFQQNKKLVTTVLYTASSLGMVVVIFFLSGSPSPESAVPGELLPDSQVIPFVDAFHRLIVYPTSLSAWFGILGWAALLAVLSIAVFKWVIPGFYQEQEGAVKTEKRANQKREAPKHTNAHASKDLSVMGKQPRSIKRILWKYNFSLIQDGTLIMQYLSSKVFFPIILVGQIAVNGMDFSTVTPQYWAVCFFAGFAYAILTLNAISIVGVIISLEQENYLYMKSLPFPMNRYLKEKFWFAFTMELLLPVITVAAFVFLADVPVLLGILLLSGLIVGVFTLSQFYFVRDYRLLHLDWQNLTELFNRGGGSFMQAISIFASFILGVLSVVLVAILVSILPPIWRMIVSIVIALLPLVVAGFLTLHYKKSFWTRFEE